MSLSEQLLSQGLLSGGGFDSGVGDCEGHISDHIPRAFGKMLEQFRPSWDADTFEVIEDAGGPYRLGQLIEVLIGQLQTCEDTACDLLRLRDVWSATGDQLDIIGRIVGIDRSDWGISDDEVFRSYIFAKIVANGGGGQPEIVREIVRIFTTPTYVQYQEYYPASAIVASDGQAYSYQLLWQMIQNVRPAGVRIDYVAVPTPTVFAFSDNYSETYPNGGGFDSVSTFSHVVTEGE